MFTGTLYVTMRYLVQNCPLPDHMTSSFLPDMLDPAADDVASRLGKNFGGRTQTALMFPSRRHRNNSHHNLLFRFGLCTHFDFLDALYCSFFVGIDLVVHTKTMNKTLSNSTHLWGFFFFIIFAETPACSEKNKITAHLSNT